MTPLQQACREAVSRAGHGWNDEPTSVGAFYAYQRRCNQRSAAYRALVAESERLELPTRYHGDLYRIDAAVLAGELGWTAYGDRPFIWVLNPLGTHLLPLESWGGHSVAECGMASLARAVASNYPAARWYHWDGSALRSVTAKQALVLIEDAEAKG